LLESIVILASLISMMAYGITVKYSSIFIVGAVGFISALVNMAIQPTHHESPASAITSFLVVGSLIVGAYLFYAHYF